MNFPTPFSFLRGYSTHPRHLGKRLCQTMMNRLVERTCDDAHCQRSRLAVSLAGIAGPLWRSQRRRMSSAHRAARNESCVSIWRLHALIPYAHRAETRARSCARGQERRAFRVVSPRLQDACRRRAAAGSAHGAAAPSRHTHTHTTPLILPSRNMAGSQRTARCDSAVLTVFVLLRANNVSLRRSSVRAVPKWTLLPPFERIARCTHALTWLRYKLIPWTGKTST